MFDVAEGCEVTVRCHWGHCPTLPDDVRCHSTHCQLYQTMFDVTDVKTLFNFGLMIKQVSLGVLAMR